MAPIETRSPPVKAIILCPDIRFEPSNREPEARLAEAEGLARAIDLDIVDSQIVRVREIEPSSLFGRGKVEQIGEIVEDRHAGLVVVDHALSPAQQRELETAWKAKVIDRTGLILEIFGERAHTREGQLQVELAALQYQRSRLVRSWTHLERQRGGFGFLGGPGESQLEIDRRLTDKRIVRIKVELDTVKNSRSLQRRSRIDPVMALVGYTNAGKSTLFNRLTRSGVMAADMLFATLDPAIRQAMLPSGWPVLVSDTVGFVSDLPTGLVAAFSATLEEVRQADIILHVRDVSHRDTVAQRDDVLKVLEEDLGIAPDDSRLLEVLNKADLALPEAVAGTAIRVSALTGQGMDALLAEIDLQLATDRERVQIEIDSTDDKGLAALYRQGRVLDRHDDDGTTRVTLERRVNK